MRKARAKAVELSELGYGKGNSEIHIIETRRKVIALNDRENAATD